METLYLSLFPSFKESSWEVASPIVLSFYVVSQILFNVLGTTQLSMAYIYGFPKDSPSSTHSAAVVTPSTL